MPEGPAPLEARAASGGGASRGGRAVPNTSCTRSPVWTNKRAARQNGLSPLALASRKSGSKAVRAACWAGVMSTSRKTLRARNTMLRFSAACFAVTDWNCTRRGRGRGRPGMS